MGDDDEQLYRVGNVLRADLWYPRVEGRATHVEIDLIDVRSADSIRVSYDFDRDGWIVEQPTDVLDEQGSLVRTDWTEVGFFGAREMQKDEPG